MKNITIIGYSAKELSGKARFKVLSDYSDINIYDDWFQGDVEEFKIKMEGYGINCEVYFSGFYSQGDGACLVSDTIDTEALVRRLFEEGELIPEDCLLYSGDLTIRVEKRDGRYNHENTVVATVYKDDDSIIADADTSALEAITTGWVRNQCIQFYGVLETTYASLTADQAILDRLDEDEYYFTIDGNIIPA